MVSSTQKPPQAKVLVTNDLRSNLNGLEVALSHLNCEIVRFGSAQNLLDYVLGNDATVILLDSQVTDENVFETATRIRALRPIPIMFFAPHAPSDQQIQMAYDSGGIDFIIQPFEPRLLSTKISIFIELQAARHDLALGVRSEVQRQSRESDEKLRLVANAIPDFISYLDRAGRYQFVNQTYERWLGVPESRIRGQSVTSVLGDQGGQVSLKHLEHVLNGESARFESIIRLRSGKDVCLDVSYTPDIDENGHVRGCVVFGHDITEQKLVAEKLITSEQDQTFRADLTEKLNVINDAETLIHVAKEALIAYLKLSECCIADFSTSQKSDQPLARWANELAKALPLPPRHRALSINNVENDPVHLSVGIKAFISVPFVRGGKVVGSLNLFDKSVRAWTEREITLTEALAESICSAIERAGLMRALRLSSRRSDFLSEASRELNSSLDVDSILQRLADLSVPEFAEWCSIRLLLPDGSLKTVAVSHQDADKARTTWELHKLFPDDRTSASGPYHVLRTGKSEMTNLITKEMIVAAVSDPKHREFILSLDLRSWLCVPIKTRDLLIGTLSMVTTQASMRTFSNDDLKLAEELGARAGVAVDNARLFVESQNINRLKDEFLANLSHELRTPMNVIQGHTEILRTELQDLSEREVQASLEAIERNAKAQTAIIADLLDVSSIITGKISFKPMRIAPAKTVSEIIESLLPTAQAKGISLVSETNGAPDSVLADSTRLHQILWNLVSNSLKFTASGGRVTVSIKQSEHEWSIRVDDTGRGIDPDFLPYVFDRFRQEDATTSRRYGGLGLGLSIVRHLIELHGGSIRAESAGREKGAAFIATFPLDYPKLPVHAGTKRETANLSPLPLHPLNSSALNDVKILLVEDSADSRELVLRILDRAGANVRAAESAAQARLQLETYTPDVIVSDIGMPGENGLEFIKKLRGSGLSKDQNIPAIALTAYVREEEKRAAISAGFQAHVAKPVSAVSLIGVIHEILRLEPNLV